MRSGPAEGMGRKSAEPDRARCITNKHGSRFNRATPATLLFLPNAMGGQCPESVPRISKNYTAGLEMRRPGGALFQTGALKFPVTDG